MPQPLSSSLWQPRANALIRLSADCKGEGKEREKKRNNRSSRPAWGPQVQQQGGVGQGGGGGGGAFIFILALLLQL